MGRGLPQVRHEVGTGTPPGGLPGPWKAGLGVNPVHDWRGGGPGSRPGFCPQGTWNPVPEKSNINMD